ncbi:MAG: ribonuclease J, partial [Massilioclostridium sp.]|nr:ribonuclease J [Massilioclostridium sp.]
MTTENQKNNQNRNQAREQGGSNSRPRRNNRRPNPNNAHKAAQQGTPANKPANQGQQQNKPAKQPRQNRQNDKKPAKTVRKTPVRIIPIGGLNEIGKNMTCIECGQDMFIIDCGMAFPDPDMLGVDLVLPDYTYVEKNIDRLRGIVITHGHEDHIGGVPFFLKRFNVPIYGTRLAIGLIEGKLKEHGLLGRAKLNVVAPKQMIKMGCMAVEMIHVNHSIPDAVGLAVHTPAGVLVHTGDFKIDYSPVEGSMIDLAKFAELGSRGVLLLMSDSTNAERPGYTPSERTVGESFSNLFNQAGNRRIIVASFASNIHRIQQIIDNAVKYGRKVAVSGRSMENVVAKAIELGYLHMPDGLMIDINQINRYPHEKLIVVTTGSQG